MLYPSLASLLDQVNSRYLLVNVISRRARDISTGEEPEEEYLIDKPVSKAIHEIASNKLHVNSFEEL